LHISSTSPRPPTCIAISGGDPAGIGLDIALDAWCRRDADELPAFAIYTDRDALAARVRALGHSVPLQIVADPRDAAAAFRDTLPVVHIPNARTVVPGSPDAANGRAVITAIEQATAAVAAGRADALVTNPIAKHVLYDAGFAHPGHTEFLAELAGHHYPGTTPVSVMMLAAEELRVVPLTIHVALSRVPGLVDRPSIERTVRIMHAALIRDFGLSHPRIAVAGLNPHAGENATMGTEERDIIEPAIAALRSEGLTVTGPHSADTLFHPAARALYDAVLAMYHDQALIPLKTLAFDRGVNITLGLPFVRTSPDHGTAFDIAGTGQASSASLVAALKTARDMARQRAAYTPTNQP
jgi:4-hydroxythreonine-4-phosphate dehydrogenase